MAPKFYVEEEVARQTVDVLRGAGFDAVYARDLSHYAWSDPRHLVYAVENGYTVVTANKNDFLSLHELWTLLEQKRYLPLSHVGILTARKQLRPRLWLGFIQRLVSSGESLTSALFVWDEATQSWQKF